MSCRDRRRIDGTCEIMEGMHDQNRWARYCSICPRIVLGWKVEVDTAFGEELYTDAKRHVCLQHGEKHTKARCLGGHKQAVPIMLDMVTFLPPFPFHIAIEIVLVELENVGYQP